LPGLIDTLSRNIHESYPQMLFETGIVFLKNNDEIKEEIHLACVSAHNDANFTAIKSTLQSFLKMTFGLECKTITASKPMFVDGRSADIFVKNNIGEIGEILPEIANSFKLRVPIAGFEIRLTGLY